MFVIFFVKNYQENLHPYATVRYIMLFALFYFVLVLSLKFDQPNNKKNILMVIILLSLVLPSKSIGFFLPHKIYLNDKINFEYYSFVNNLRKIKKEFKFEKNINNFIYVSNNSLSSIERSRLYFEFYPDIYRNNNQNIFTINEYIELKNVIKKMKNANKRIKENDIIREKNIHNNIILTQADLEGFDENTIVKKLKVKN